MQTTTVTILMMWVLNVTDASSIQRTIISLDKKGTGLEISMIFFSVYVSFNDEWPTQFS